VTRLHRALGALWVVAAAGVWVVAALPATGRAAAYVGLHAALSALMLAVWATARGAGPGAWRWTLACGIAARLAVAGVPSFTSHDVQRYLWDGGVLLAGHDPWRLAPDAPALAALRARWPTPAEFAAWPTLYPPGALLLFALAAVAGPARGALVWKAIAAAASLATLVAAAALGRARGAERHLALVALSPLLVLEAGVGGHVDTLAALGVAGALVLAERRRVAGAGAALGAGALAKLLPAVALVPLAAACDRRRALLCAGTGAGVVAAGYAVALAAGLHPLGSLPDFLAGWRFGSPLFSALATVLGGGAAAAAAAVALAAAGLAVAVRVARAGRAVAGVQVALASVLVASPVVFPWYLAVLVPGLVAVPSAFVVAWVTAAPITYEVLDRVARTGAWTPAAWPLWTIAAAWVVGLAIDLCYTGACASASSLPSSPATRRTTPPGPRTPDRPRSRASRPPPTGSASTT
jgi:Glycosyltransferase family 87